MPKYDGASAKTNGYVNAAIGGAGGLFGHIAMNKVNVKEVFPNENPVMPMKHKEEIDNSDPQYAKKK